MLIAGLGVRDAPDRRAEGLRAARDAVRARRATELARSRGVRDLPAVYVPGAGVFHGDAELELAARELGAIAR